MYNKILRIYEFIKDNEINQDSWKFAKLKRMMQIDEQTFSFDLICHDGAMDQEQI